jgi:excisionase family DNA binding protein
MVLLTPKEVAERLRVSPRTVYSWIESGRLGSVRLSQRVTRVPEDAVESLVRGALVVPAEPTRHGEPPSVDPSVGGSVAALVREKIALNREAIVRIAADNRAENVRVFGSVARGDARADSDVDLLVDARPDASLLDLSRIGTRIGEVLGRRVDVVAASDLKPLIREDVLAEAVPL